jgi:arylsulfatase
MGNFYFIILDSLRQASSEGMFPGMESSGRAVCNFPRSFESHAALLTENKAEDILRQDSDSWLEQGTLASLFSGKGYRTVSISANGFFQPYYGYEDFDKHHDLEHTVPFNPKEFREIRDAEDFWESTRELLRRSLKKPSLLLDNLIYVNKSKLPNFFSDYGLKEALELMSEEREEPHLYVANIMEFHAPRTPPFYWCLRNGYWKLPLMSLKNSIKYGHHSQKVHKESEEAFHREAYSAMKEYVSEKISEWKKEHISDEDTLVITSDHGELLGKYGLFGHGHGFVPEQFNVPLFYSGNIEFDEFVSLDDIYDVISEKLDSGGDLETPDETHFFIDSDGVGENKWDKPQRGFINKEFRQVNFEESGDIEFYKPFEQKEIGDKELVDIPEMGEENEIDPKDEEVKERLEKLGYMQ